jgi:UDP-N-acetylmuramyl pentapeptide phosphotransferase/UDP-N-acetylglucosamine-1-phosphate transferase
LDGDLGKRMIFTAVWLIFIAGGTAGLIAGLLPWLHASTLARVEARSSHEIPTPQGAGIAVVAGILAGTTVFRWADLSADNPAGRVWLALGFAAILLSAVGFLDDRRPLGVRLRLAAQAIAMLSIALALPNDWRSLPETVPLGLERAAIIVLGMAAINLVNFMDGIDLLTVVEVVTITGGIAILRAFGLAPETLSLAALTIGAATLGFAFFNVPPARVFLGDAGSLPLGLFLAACLFGLASSGHPTATVLLPLYYLADGGITLALRIVRGQPFWQAHRQHFYQQATRAGRFTVLKTVSMIATTNLGLVLLAVAAEASSAAGKAAAIAVGCGLVGVLLFVLSDRGQTPAGVSAAGDGP